MRRRTHRCQGEINISQGKFASYASSFQPCHNTTVGALLGGPLVGGGPSRCQRISYAPLGRCYPRSRTVQAGDTIVPEHKKKKLPEKSWSIRRGDGPVTDVQEMQPTKPPTQITKVAPCASSEWKPDASASFLDGCSSRVPMIPAPRSCSHSTISTSATY